MSELLEKILSKDNMNVTYKRVCANKGAGGVDDVTVDELGDYIKENWGSIREQIRRREYKPQPARRVEISKPNGGVRELGIPTVMDRVIQQGIVQVIIREIYNVCLGQEENPETEECVADAPTPYPVENARHNYAVDNGNP